MIDFHSHVLPRVDDGSRSIAESIAMLRSMKAQGVEKVIATPHFLANNESVDSFISRRNKSYNALMEQEPNGPEILLGAEIKYYDGISRLPDLKKLRIEDSRLLLLEMPFSQWTEYAIKEIIDIAGRGKITLVLAHIDRYVHMQKRDTLPRLLENGVLFQANTSFFTSYFIQHKAPTMLMHGQIHFIGSDCHNMTERVPNTAKAVDVIRKKLGDDFAYDYMNYGNELFLQNKLS